MTALLSGNKEQPLDIEQAPSLDWNLQALASGQICLLHALETSNKHFTLGFDSQLKEATEALTQAVKK
jgi:hypothetical protein